MKIQIIAVLAIGLSLAGMTQEVVPIDINVSTNVAIVRELITVTWDAGTNRVPSFNYIALFPAGDTNTVEPDGFPRFTARTSRPTRNIIIGIPGEYEFRHIRRVSGGIFSPRVYETLSVSETFKVREPVVDPSHITNWPGRSGPVIAFGDSLTFGLGATEGEDYISELMRRLGCPVVHIENAGVSGDTTADALARLETDVLSKDPRLVIKWFGGNDYLQRVPKETTYTNLLQMVDECHDEGAMVILVGLYQRTSSSVDRFDELAEVYWRVARETGCAYVPNVLVDIIDNSRLRSVNVHPNDQGYEFVARRLVSTVATLLSSPTPLGITTLGVNGPVQISFRLIPGVRYEILANDSLPLETGIARVYGNGDFVLEVPPLGEKYFYGVRPLPSSDDDLIIDFDDFEDDAPDSEEEFFE